MQLQRQAEELAERCFLGGPVEYFEAIGRLQLITLLRLGLYPSSKVLDIGCGCLRGGYWLLHFLDADGYCGLEPNTEMLQMGLDSIVAPELVAQKRPRFDSNDRFDASVFRETFDFFIARSIWTHASKSQIETMLESFVATSNDDGLFLTSYHRATRRKQDYKGEGWVGRSHESNTGGIVNHTLEWIEQECARRGLHVHELSFDRLRHVWLAVTKKAERTTDRWLSSLHDPLALPKGGLLKRAGR